jgi:hypothetical protein
MGQQHLRCEIDDRGRGRTTYDLTGEVFFEQSDGNAVILVLPDPHDATTLIQLLRDRLSELEVVHRCNTDPDVSAGV